VLFSRVRWNNVSTVFSFFQIENELRKVVGVAFIIRKRSSRDRGSCSRNSKRSLHARTDACRPLWLTRAAHDRRLAARTDAACSNLLVDDDDLTRRPILKFHRKFRPLRTESTCDLSLVGTWRLKDAAGQAFRVQL
jgi:hypothetical protein